MARNLVIFCDGTGNELRARGNTNVLRLHAMTLETPSQVRYYSAGVGTKGSPKALTSLGRSVTRVLGLAFGYGLKDNVVDCYTFLMRRWEPGDRIYLFGFSRGAYAARALAGMLRVVGLLRPDQENMVPYALKLFWKSRGQKVDWDTVKEFTRQFSREDFDKWGHPVKFLGVWDTVKAVGWFTRRLQLPYTRLLKSAETVRHACSLDEWRAQYKAYLVSQDELNKPERDIREAWFPGVHSDVGGSYEPDGRLGEISLGWLGAAAVSAGLEVDDDAYSSLVELPEGHADGEVHGLGRIWVLAGVSRRRVIPPAGAVHESVRRRMAKDPADQARYRKKGVGDANPVEPWQTIPIRQPYTPGESAERPSAQSGRT